MANIYNYLNHAFHEIKSVTRSNPAFIFFLLVFLTIPLGYAVNGVAVALFTAVSLITFKKTNFLWQWDLCIPMLLYLLMAASFFWSHDTEATLRATTKVLPLFVLPLVFMINPLFSETEKHLILKYYSFGIVLFTVFYLIQAVVRYMMTADTGVFFYHGLVTKDVNAIHVSIFVTVAFFYFFIKPVKSFWDNIAMLILAIFIVLLSSKNILIVLFLLILFYELFYFKATQKIKLIFVLILAVLSMTILYSSQIRDRFLEEFRSNPKEGTINHDFTGGVVHNVSIQQAWSKETFQPSDYFASIAFRVYQIRIFNEMLQEDPILFTGYGLNATDFKIEEKGIQHNIFLGDAQNEGYQKKNFHNQYIQIFAEVGIFGLMLLLMLVFLNLRNAFKTKHFIHICFAILMISLFLTESFLARQRGVVFFSAMYCLFNSGVAIQSFKKK